MPTYIAVNRLPHQRPTKLHCSACGAKGEIGCGCGVEFIRAGDFAAKVVADPANAGKSNRVIAEETGLSEPTVRRVRSGASKDAPEPERVIGADGKSYPARKTGNVIQLRHDKTGEEWTELAQNADHALADSLDHPGDGLKVEPAPIASTSPSAVARSTTEDRQVLTLEQFFSQSSGADIFERIPAAKRPEVLAAYTVKDVIKTFGEQLRAALPANPISKLRDMDNDTAASTLIDAFGPRIDAIIEIASVLRAPKGRKIGSNKAPKHKMTLQVGVDATRSQPR